MKHKRHPRIWLIILLLFAVVLSACVRPIPGRDDDPTAEPAPPSGVQQPEVDPPAEIVAPDGYPAPSQTDATTSEPAPADGAEQPAEPATDAAPAEDTSGEAGGGAPETAQPITEAVSHTVLAGETLGVISERYGVSVDEIAAANNLTDVNTLSAGQQLIIPVPGTVSAPATDDGTTAPTAETTHTVLAGENLFRIGLRYGFTVEQLASHNGIADPTRIDVGHIIRIPAGN